VISLILTSCGDPEGGQFEFPVPSKAKCNERLPVWLVDRGTVRLCGPLDGESVALALTLFENSDAQNLIIDSGGGFARSSIVLSRYLRKHDITVFVNHFCASACSQYIAMAAPRLVLRESSVFVMHDTQASTNRLLGQALVHDVIRDVASMERQFYREIGISQDLLYLPAASLGISCVRRDEYDPKTGQLSFVSSYGSIMPDKKSFLEYYPGELMSNWPEEDIARKMFNKWGRFVDDPTYGRFF